MPYGLEQAIDLLPVASLGRLLESIRQRAMLGLGLGGELVGEGREEGEWPGFVPLVLGQMKSHFADKMSQRVDALQPGDGTIGTSDGGMGGDRAGFQLQRHMAAGD